MTAVCGGLGGLGLVLVFIGDVRRALVVLENFPGYAVVRGLSLSFRNWFSSGWWM